MDIEEVASKTPEKIITTRLNITDKVSDNDVLNILKPYNLKQAALEDGKNNSGFISSFDKNRRKFNRG